MTAYTKPQSMFGAIAARWREWKKRRTAIAEVAALGDAEMARVAHDVNLSAPQLQTLAGKWPDSAGLLSQRLASLRFDEEAMSRTEPAVLRDLQRVCTLCSDKAHCVHDIDRDPTDPAWRDYCPNVSTLDALDTERSLRRLDHGGRA